MVSRAFRPALVVLAFSALAACQPDARCGLRACDIREANCQKMASAAAACLTGQPAREIPVVLLARRQLIADTVAETNQADQTRERLRLQALAHLALADDDVSPVEAATALSDRLGAFYDSRTKRITIITDDDRPLDGAWYTSLLVHELTHALQDAAGRLAFPFGDGDTSYDRLIARGALVEGEASLAETLTTLELFEYPEALVPWDALFARLRTLSARAAAASAVPADLAYSYFAYPFGLALVYPPYAAQRTAGVAGLWAMPPRSSRTIMLPQSAPELEPPVVEELGPDSVPDLTAAAAFLEGDRMGAFVFKVALLRAERNARAQTSRADELARHLRGDYLSLWWWPGPDNNSATATSAAFWRLRFSNEATANQTAAYLHTLIAADPKQPKRSALPIGRDVILSGFATLPEPLPTTWKAPPAPMPTMPAAGAFLCPRHDPLVP
jgi:hypothetical protein